MSQFYLAPRRDRYAVPRPTCPRPTCRARDQPGGHDHTDRSRSTTVTSSHCPTSRPFTVVLCTSCAAKSELGVLEALRAAVRRCGHGVLVTTECMLGALACATLHNGAGGMVVLQPCSVDRPPSGPAHGSGRSITRTTYVPCVTGCSGASGTTIRCRNGCGCSGTRPGVISPGTDQSENRSGKRAEMQTRR